MSYLTVLCKGFLMISGGVEVNPFAYICLMLETEFGDDP